MLHLRLNTNDRRRQEGQVLVLFAIALLAIIAMGGLVVDGGGAFAQRRSQQNGADLAALAGADAYLNALAGGASQATASTAADATARQVATANGYTDAVAGTTVSVSVTPATLVGRSTVTVTITRPHRNNFASVIGQPTWTVGATATALTGVPNAAVGAAPLIFNKKTMQPGSSPPYDPFNSTDGGNFYNEPGNGNQDVPLDQTQFNWTVFCTANGNPCNGNSNTADDLIRGIGTNTTVATDELIGPLNAGSHTTLFNDVLEAKYGWVNREFPVSIVDDNGNMLGWALFHLTSAQGGSEKVLQGYFVSGVHAASLDIVNCGPNPCPAPYNFGAYVLKLIN